MDQFAQWGRTTLCTGNRVHWTMQALLSGYWRLALLAVLAFCAAITEPAQAAQVENRLDYLMMPRKFAPSEQPVPRFVSLKRNKVNMRKGPSDDHAIDWVYNGFQNLPMLVIAESGPWRKVIDHDGYEGWIHTALLSGKRSALVEGDAEAYPLLDAPRDDALLAAQVQPGALAIIEVCRVEWCRLVFGDVMGWMKREHLWGVLPTETIN